MAFPAAITFIGIPYAGLAYGDGLTIFAGYSAINNGHSLYQEYYEKKLRVKAC
jgi:hypothetical protein